MQRQTVHIDLNRNMHPTHQDLDYTEITTALSKLDHKGKLEYFYGFCLGITALCSTTELKAFACEAIRNVQKIIDQLEHTQ
jgi:hypothetical protein